ncbi:tyrosine-type recombinase/integrase [Photobacterium sp. TY1-4]|uniref:tyrosine-type recombinase/integrase n=1 Tax=Photobacterium sp. TY1-4 TaxID=2899122 RepID=UPI0021BF99CD|nr:site-specific integrase [Photobacterium sp. TY1-4]UXI01132.1 integrase arm-type DNA-binding domain-containing protein [Photobacterium sp. TY1-4]
MNKLFDKNLKAALNKPRDKTVVLNDGGGLGARVSPLGKVRWQYRYKIDGNGKRLDLGDYPEVSLVKARETARQCREWLAEGYDPKLQRAIQRNQTLKPVTVKDALEYWLTEYAEENRANASKHRAQFKRHIYPYIGDYPLSQTETHHWLECFDRARKGIPGKRRPAPVAAGYVLQNAKQALRFCRVRHYATSRVLDDLVVTDVGKKQQKRDRYLTDQELGDVWRLFHDERYLRYYRHLIRLLMVFGARTQEVRLSKWDEWDFECLIWTVPKSHCKTNIKITRPIPEQLKSWLLELKAANKENDYVLGELKKPEAVSQTGGQFWKRLGHKEPWTLHDLRRTLDTRMNDLGIAPPYVVEQLLGHTMPGIMAIYNRSQYLPEKAEALDKWVEWLELISTQPHNVVLMRA